MSKSEKLNFNYNNIEKMSKNFMYYNLKRANCYNCDFSMSNFNYVSFRGAHLKKCNFYKGSFVGAEFVGANLKGSKFRKAKFENTIFEGVNLDGVDFSEAEFNNTIFYDTDTSKAKSINLGDRGIRIFGELPELEISEELKAAIESVMENPFIKEARIFDNKDKEINILTLLLLLEKFNEQDLIKGLGIIKEEIKREFHTLSYIMRLLEKSI